MDDKILDDKELTKLNPPNDFSKFPIWVERMKALAADLVVQLLLIFSFGYLFNEIGEIPDSIRMISFIFIFFLYEPLYVFIFGGSIGHFVMGLRVKRASDFTKNINLISVLFRYAIKIILGVLSFLTVSSDEKRRAIHDKIVGSVVIYKT